MESERHEGDKIYKQSRDYLSSLEAHPRKLSEAIHAHWGIENKVHWALDVCFREDLNRTRQKKAAKNTALLRRFALNVIRREPMQTLGETLQSWDQEIVRMWRFSKSNGITEGFHNKMETISRRAYGFRNFENYRLRVRTLCG